MLFADGTHTLVNVERLKFANIGLAFNIKGNARLTLKSVASGFIDSAEFQGLYGANPTDTQFVNLLYSNVLNRVPDQAGSDYWIGQMQGGMTREMVLIGFSESAENQAALIGVIQNGITYMPA